MLRISYFIILWLLLVLKFPVETKNAGVYQDLTEPIDKILKEGKLNYVKKLQEALKDSPYVYYSTDLLLNNITMLTPVLKLLDKAKPQSSSYFMILSLRYTNQNRFSWQRLDDMFYDLSLSINSELQTFLRYHLTSVVLDWSVETCENSATFFTQSTSHPGYGFGTATVSNENTANTIPYIFPKYVKNFIRFYCGDSRECSNIQVGVAYNPIQMHCGSHLLPQIRDADFLLISIRFPTYSEFPFLYPVFKGYLSVLRKQTEQFIGVGVNKTLIFNVDLNGPPTTSEIKSKWQQTWPDLEVILSASKYYDDSIQNLIGGTYKKSLELLPEFLSIYIQGDRYGISMETADAQGTSVVLGKMMIRNSAHFKKESEIRSNWLIIPRFFTNEVEATSCGLKWGLMTDGMGSAIVNAHTWRAAARYKHELLDPNLDCSNYRGDHAVNKPSNRNSTEILILFDNDIITMWDTVQKYVIELLKQTTHIGTAAVRSLIFTEFGISKSISNFVTEFAANYSIGCVVNLNKERVEILKLQSIFIDESKFKGVMKSLCSPHWEQINTIIWDVNVDTVNFAKDKEIVIVARDVFMKEFPGKRIILSFSMNSIIPMEYIGAWTEYYGVPVAV